VSALTRAALPPETADESPELAQERHFLNDVMFDPAQNAEHLLLTACDEAAVSLLDQPGPLFGDRPVIVLQAPLPTRPPGLPRSYDAVARAAWVEANVEFAAESTRGAVVEVEDTGHDIHVDQPEVVMDAIREVMAG
jgi:pimeloyl-ACP methyl ester carboxylesterase